MPKHESAFLDSLNKSVNLPHIQMLTEQQKTDWNKNRSENTDKGTPHISDAFYRSGEAATDTLYLNPEDIIPSYKAEIAHSIDRQRSGLSPDEYDAKLSKEFDQFGFDVYKDKTQASEANTHNVIEPEVDKKHNAAKNKDVRADILKENQKFLDTERNTKKEIWLEENKPENKDHKYHPENLKKESKLKYF